MSEAIDFVNSRSKPLCLYLFTESTELEKRVVNETLAGSISINETVIHVSFFR
jgi:aldehyde dehydrogenase (NAD+)